MFLSCQNSESQRWSIIITIKKLRQAHQHGNSFNSYIVVCFCCCCCACYYISNDNGNQSRFLSQNKNIFMFVFPYQSLHIISWKTGLTGLQNPLVVPDSQYHSAFYYILLNYMSACLLFVVWSDLNGESLWRIRRIIIITLGK